MSTGIESAPRNTAGKTPAARPKPDVMPSLFGAGYGTYQVQPSNFYLSFLLHTVALALVLFLTHQAITHKDQLKDAMQSVVDISPYLPMQASKTTAGGGGGGGEHSKLLASRGTPPKPSLQQITPPTAVIRNDKPMLPVEQTIVVPPQIKLPQSNT